MRPYIVLREDEKGGPGHYYAVQHPHTMAESPMDAIQKVVALGVGRSEGETTFFVANVHYWAEITVTVEKTYKAVPVPKDESA